jgi:hypothetical protein
VAERGGTTTQSGIYYQNTIAAFYLGRLCHSTQLPSYARVVEVCSETLSPVDDIVVTYEDNHKDYIQAKEALTTTGDVWKALWADLVEQFQSNEFQHKQDRLVLYLGEYRDEYRDLRGMAERTDGSPSYASWEKRLTKGHKALLHNITEAVTPTALPAQDLVHLFRHLDIKIEPVNDLELNALREMPPSNVPAITLFRLLRDRAAGQARTRKPFTALELRASLEAEHNIKFSNISTPLATNTFHSNQTAFLPEDRLRTKCFVSSRMKNGILSAERAAAVDCLESTGIITPWVWEQYIPVGEFQYEEICLHFAASSDCLLLILDKDISPLCFKEYNAAAGAYKPCFIFIKADTALESSAENFLEEQRSQGRHPVRFRNTKELKSLLRMRLSSECLRAFRHSHIVTVQTVSPSAKMELEK